MAEAAVGFLLENLKQILLHHVKLVQDAKKEVEALVKDLQLFSSFLKDSTNTSESMKQLVRDIRGIVYEIEDAIDVYVAVAADKKSSNYFKKLFSAPTELIRVAKQAQEISARVSHMLRSERIELVRLGGENAEHQYPQLRGLKVRKDNIVGFDDEADTLIRYLKEETKHVDAISIIGLPGLGKTTLASKIFHDPRIEYEFATRIWVYVSQEFKKKDVFLAILENFVSNTDSLNGKSDVQITQMLHKHLEGKGKYLVVMDDVWTDKAWDELKDAFPETNKQGKILITSRKVEVAHKANPFREPHKLRFLTVEESWQLLQLEAFHQIRCPTELVVHGKLIVARCGGLPLAIVVIGGILFRREVSVSIWRNVSESVPTCLMVDDDQLDKIISLSYNELPYHLRSCFLYLGMFPEHFEIRVWNLIRMWIAEGFIQSKTDRTLEGTAQEYLKELINRNLVMVEKVSMDGKIKTCRIHDTLRQFCKKESGVERENFFQEMRKSTEGGFEPPTARLEDYRRLCIHSNIVDFISTPELYGPRIRSFLCNSNEERIVLQTEHWASIPDAFRLLRILDAKPITFTKMPRKITSLVHLRYVVLSGEFEVLPEVISKLWNLETLVVYTPHRTIEIKANIWKMIQLRHVKTNASAIFPKMGRSTNDLGEKLQTLGAISPQNCTEDMFDRARSLRKLCIRGKLSELLGVRGFDKLDKLEKLKLVNDVSANDKLPYLPQSYMFPPKIRSLTLCATRLDWLQMSTLGMLDTLEVLKLKENAFTGETWEASASGFRHLEVFHIERTDLIVWQAEANLFPRLKYLVLRNCERLQEIPVTLAEVESFQHLYLQRVSQATCESARVIEELKKAQEEKRENQSAATINPKFKLYIAPGDEWPILNSNVQAHIV